MLCPTCGQTFSPSSHAKAVAVSIRAKAQLLKEARLIDEDAGTVRLVEAAKWLVAAEKHVEVHKSAGSA